MNESVRIITLGCKVNQYESTSFQNSFEEFGFTVVHDGDAEIVVVNTCGVTGAAGSQSRQVIRKILRENPECRLVVTGCYAELLDPEFERELNNHEVLLVGNSRKEELVRTIVENRPGHILGDIMNPGEISRLKVRRFGSRSRAYLKVQDGCQSYCSYCIVPYTRGPSRSLPPDEAIQQARVLAAQGYREIVITGIHLGYYGQDLTQKSTLFELVDRLSLATPDTRYRISSLEPTEIDRPLLELIRDRTNLQPHLHIPLQSGCDSVLSRMNRRYTTTKFRNTVHLCREIIPDCGIGLDILAGFPGETEKEFEESCLFLTSLPFSYLHVFPYSKRPGTPAAEMADQIPGEIKKQRAARLRAIGADAFADFAEKQVGSVHTVLVENRRDSSGLLKAVTGNYLPVHFSGDDRLLGMTATVKLTRYEAGKLYGEEQTA